MKFVLFVEGPTERRALPTFFKRWLDPRLGKRVGINPVPFKGWADYEKGIVSKVALNLSGKAGADVIAGIGLLDLYGPTFHPHSLRRAADRYLWAKQYIEDKVNNPRFRQHFAVHETEAWLLASPEIFPPPVRASLPGRHAHPEAVNFDEPPKKLLTQLYRERLGERYNEVIEGANLFPKLDPDVAYRKCPYLKQLLDEMLALAQAAGL